MLPTLVVGWRASGVTGKEVGHFREVVGMSSIVARCLSSATNTLTVDSRVA